MGQYYSSGAFYGSLWSETLANSGNYSKSNFVPAQFTFDVNPDTLELENISIVSRGTGLPITRNDNTEYRRHYLGESPTSDIRLYVDTHKSLGVFYYNSPYFTGLGWFKSITYGWIDSGDAKNELIYVGAFYLEESEATYFFLAYDDADGSGIKISHWRNIENISGSNNWTETKVDSMKAWILHLFYAIMPKPEGEVAEKLITYGDWTFAGIPNLFQVKPGNTVTLEFELVINEDESIRPFTDISYKIEQYVDGKLLYVDIPSDFATVDGTSITISQTAKGPVSYGVYAIANGYTTADGDYLKSNAIILTILSNAYDGGGSSTGGLGGNGSFSGPGGSWGNGIGPSPSKSVVGDLPNGSAEQDSSRTGLFTRYGMSAAQLYTVGAALYVEDILANIGKEIMSFLWNSPSEALISLISYPFSVTELVGSTATNIKFGSLQLEVTGNALSGTFAQIDWGTIQLEEFWGNFLDYAPHTKIDLYLPWCTGTVPIDPHECLPGSLSVKTNIELSKGTCVHNVFGNKGALIGTYSGTCGSQLPMTSLDTAGKALALVTAATGTLVAGAAAGGAKSAGITAANTPPKTLGLSHSELISDQLARIKEAEAPYRKIQKGAQGAALASSIAAFKNPAHVVRNGSFSASGAGMGMQFPFIIISRPEQNIPDGYSHYYGYPSNVYTRLGAVSGYAEIGSIHLDGFSTATADELIEIESLLKEGVIF